MRFAASLLAAALALTGDLVASDLAQVLPAGKFSARDGRPGPGKFWQLSDAQGSALAASLSAIAAKTPISIDYEHQSVLAATNGQAAPAAGWMTSFEWRAGAGLFATVNWTPRAKAYIVADEYRYISPVILFDPKTGDVVGLHNAALVTNPAILGMSAVQTALSAQFSDLPIPTTTTATTTPAITQPTEKPPEKKMDLITLIAMLGLAATANLQDVTATLQALIDRPALPAALCAMLGLPTAVNEPTALAALTLKLGTPDAATMAAMQALQAQVAALSTQVHERTVSEAVDAAIAANKLVPAQRDWALGLGRLNLAQLNAYVASAVAIPGLTGQVAGRNLDAPGAPSAALSPVQTMLAAQLGLNATAYLARINAQAAA